MVRAGLEFVVELGKKLLVVRALYCLKVASDNFRSFMANY